MHDHCDAVDVDEGDDGPGQDLGFGCVGADFCEWGGEGVGDGRDLHDVSFRCFVFTIIRHDERRHAVMCYCDLGAISIIHGCT